MQGVSINALCRKKENYQQICPTETKDCKSRNLKICTRTSWGSWTEPASIC